MVISPVGNTISESYWQETNLVGEGEYVGSEWEREGSEKDL